MSGFTLGMLEQEIGSPFWSKLLQSPLSSKVGSSAAELAALFELSRLPFFREYTDHSFKHSIDVFKTACEICSHDAEAIVSSEDLSCLLLACILHDAGLHITEDIFFALTDQSNSAVVCPAFDDKPWVALWNEFIAEAKRFNAKKLISIFGNAEPVCEPPRTAAALSQRDRLLIGEFLRRHHPRYAHELALGMIPSATGKKLSPLRELDNSTQDIIGLIARSHGMPLRSTFDYVQTRYHLRDYNRIHAIYLMVALRIADYLQIQPARAPKVFEEIHKINSPFSASEWRVHQCIANITTSSLDPEAIHVAANPLSVHDYIKFEKWATGLQQELDQSWAVLGEVYGRFTQEQLDRLQLKIRRLRSNVEDRRSLQRHLKYVPELIKFTVAEPELLRLLMGPLYSDNPLYGLRELTQNSVDSVKELKHLISIGGNVEGERLTAGADVEITLGDGPEWRFLIKDRGTGMTLEIIKDFFLKAGASFRNSDVWKKQFADDSGRSKISRAGRFGVGALSAFLIGDKITVYTRHYSDKSGSGYRFSARIDDDEIEIVEESGKIGTAIEIQSDEKKILEIKKYLAKRAGLPFYYTLDFPNVTFDADLSNVQLQRKEIEETEDNAPAFALPAKWMKVKNSRYEKVIWDRAIRRVKDRSWDIRSGYVYCNGILIGDIAEPPSDLLISDKYDVGNVWEVVPPTVSITDYNAVLPLDLARKGFSSPEEDLATSVLTSMWEELVASIFFSKAELPSQLVEFWQQGRFMFQSDVWVPVLFGREGFSLLDETLVNELLPSKLVVLPNDPKLVDRIKSDKFFDRSTFALMRNFRGSESRSSIVASLQQGFYRYDFPNFRRRHGSGGMEFEKSYIVYPARTFDSVFELSNVPKYTREMRSNAREFRIGSNNFVIVSRSSPMTDAVVNQIAAALKRTNKDDTTPGLHRQITVACGYVRSRKTNTILSQVWNKSFTSKTIPYSCRERQQVLKSKAPIKNYQT